MKKSIRISIFSLFLIIFMLSFGCTGQFNFLKESEKVNRKNVFSNLQITDTSIYFPENINKGLIKGKLTNTSTRNLAGNFKIIFYASNGGINKVYSSPIPGSGINSGETKEFDVSIDKFEYETYDFQDDNVFEK